METDLFLAIVRVVFLTVQQLFWSVLSDESQTAQFVPLQCNNVVICGSSRPFYSLSVLSLTTCTTECYFNLYKSAPCVGFNYRSTNKTCDIFTRVPIFFANDEPECQYYQDEKDAFSNCKALPGLQSVAFLASEDGTKSVYASALLNEQLFVTRQSFDQVFVYNSTSLQLLNNLTFSGLGTALNGLATDPNDNSLFISDYFNKCVHRVTFSASTVSTMKWNVTSNPLSLSLTSNGNVMVALFNKVIGEYTTNGTLVRQISDGNQLWHAVQVNHDVWAYVVRNPMRGVCTAFTNGTVIKCYVPTAGSTNPQISISNPRFLALDARGYVLVSDIGTKRILIVDPSLTEARVLTLPVSTALQIPFSVLLVPSLNRMYIGEDGGRCRILLFDIK